MTDRKYRNTRKPGLVTSGLNHCLALVPKPAIVRNRSGEVRTLRAENDEFVRWQADGWPMISTRRAWESWASA